MAKSFLLEPPALLEKLRQRYRRQRGGWLQDGGTWPLQLPLGMPSESEALANIEAVRRWVSAWQGWSGPGEIQWRERRWSRLGAQHLPSAIRFADPEAVCMALEEREAWDRALQRLGMVRDRWPQLAAVAAGNWPLLAEWPDDQFSALIDLLAWLHAHPDSGLYPRQLPVPGVHGKWLESHRRLLLEWLAALRGIEVGGQDLYRLAGLRPLPARLRLRMLDPELRASLGGLCDIESPVAEIAALNLPVQRVLIVENLQTGLAFTDLPGTVVFMKQGYAVDVFSAIPWFAGRPVYYWGDIDSHGLAILDRLRHHVPHVHSLLMDEHTLLAHRPLWGHEAKPADARALTHLNEEESALFRDLRSGRWGPGVRLEQERIAWEYAWARIRRSLIAE